MNMSGMNIIKLATGLYWIYKLSKVNAELRCPACEHIGWNETYTFNNVQFIYYLLQTKNNPACAQNNPLDRVAYEQNYRKHLPQQQQQQFLHEQDYRQRYDVRDVYCSVQCTYVFGDVTVYFIPFREYMKFNIHLRYCPNSMVQIKNGCYQRDTSSGYDDIKVHLQQTLEFLGGEEVVKVVRFIGSQCYCSEKLCNRSASITHKEASIIAHLLALLGYFAIK